VEYFVQWGYSRNTLRFVQDPTNIEFNICTVGKLFEGEARGIDKPKRGKEKRGEDEKGVGNLN
jgi:hypothetical protein